MRPVTHPSSAPRALLALEQFRGRAHPVAATARPTALVWMCCPMGCQRCQQTCLLMVQPTPRQTLALSHLVARRTAPSGQLHSRGSYSLCQANRAAACGSNSASRGPPPHNRCSRSRALLSHQPSIRRQPMISMQPSRPSTRPAGIRHSQRHTPAQAPALSLVPSALPSLDRACSLVCSLVSCRRLLALLHLFPQVVSSQVSALLL